MFPYIQGKPRYQEFYCLPFTQQFLFRLLLKETNIIERKPKPGRVKLLQMLENMFCDFSLCICMNRQAVVLCSSNFGECIEMVHFPIFYLRVSIFVTSCSGISLKISQKIRLTRTILILVDWLNTTVVCLICALHM